MKKLLGNLASCAAVLALIACTAFPAPALAQQTAKVVSTCGSVTYTAGGVNYVTMDLNGLACGSGGGGGGGVVTQSTPGNLQTLSNGAVTTAAPTYTTGTNRPLSLDTAGNLRVIGGGGGGGVAGFTSEATATAGTAGTNQPAGIDTTNKAQRVEICVPGATSCIDLSGGTAGTPGGAVSSVQGVSGMVPLDTNLKQIAGAAPSLTNPIWVANAEAADVTGTFTNATQTTSVTNGNADGYAGGLISINGTYGTATGVFEESDDGGTTYYSVICARSDGTASETGYTSLTNTNRQWACPVAGNDTVRVRSTAVASGTVNVRVGISAPTPESFGGGGGGVVTQPTASNLNAQVQGPGASGATLSGNPDRIGCAFNTTQPTVTTGQAVDAQCDNHGAQYVTDEQAGVPALWSVINPTTTISNSNTPNVPVTNAALRIYDFNSGNGFIAATAQRGSASDGSGLLGVGIVPTTAAAGAIVPVVSTTLESCHVLKASPGSLFNISVTIQAVSGVLQVFNLTAAPSAGAVTPVWSQVVISNGTFGSGAWAWAAGAPLRGSTGLVACFSSATTPFTYTSSATAMISAGVL